MYKILRICYCESFKIIDDNILELGFGCGDGIRAIYKRILDGYGSVHGLELSAMQAERLASEFVVDFYLPGGSRVVINQVCFFYEDFD